MIRNRRNSRRPIQSTGDARHMDKHGGFAPVVIDRATFHVARLSLLQISKSNSSLHPVNAGERSPVSTNGLDLGFHLIETSRRRPVGIASLRRYIALKLACHLPSAAFSLKQEGFQ